MDISKRFPRLVLARVVALAVLAPAAACDTPESATGLHPEGPPMFQQVFMREPDASDRIETVLAFGTHPDVTMAKTRAVTKAAPLGQRFRVVFDELLLANYLEEVQCAPSNDVADCPQWSHIPEGTTPDDIARCAAPDTLEELCHGDHAVCLNPEGQACGIKDAVDNPSRPPDGAPDDLRLIPGAVVLRCGNIEIGFEEASSFYQPAGNQLVPAGLVPENSLGPALILLPLNRGVIPTNQPDCHFVLAPNVVDKDHIAVCAPAGGSLDGACTPGDLGAFHFATDVLKSSDVEPQGTSVSLTSRIRITMNSSIDAPSLAASVVVKEAGVVRADAVVALTAAADKNVIEIKVPLGATAHMLKPGTVYEITATPKDTFGIPAPTPITYTFTTGT